MNKVDRIKDATIATSNYEVQETDFQALNGEASRRLEKFIFYKRDKGNLKRIKESLLAIFNKQPRELQVTGVLDGADFPFSLDNNLEVFHQQDYEDWMRNLKFTDKDKSKSVNSSQTIKDLIDIYYKKLPITRLDQRDKVII